MSNDPSDHQPNPDGVDQLLGLDEYRTKATEQQRRHQARIRQHSSDRGGDPRP
ncbi:hypothetical protein [Phytoactinopolyspora limicola]|uniref:hypothetical protein n=1 Tax=Phytoactinopolyspora limicola TaxID=2715536 RepID=UPI00140B6CA4|nr:hypothetical protein [Phytoactinopolyspora limicola]